MAGDLHPSYEELAALVVVQAERITQLQAEIAELRRQLGHDPEGGGKKRLLGIATATDRVVQASLKLALEPIFEADSLPCSYGFVRHEAHGVEGGGRPVGDA